MRTILLPLWLVAFSTPAWASDGVLEINQTCAVETGCFAGDRAGFPVTITGVAGRNYRLTSDLGVGFGNHDTDAFFISTSYITLDLGGFMVSGSALGVVTQPGTGVAINGGTTSGSAASWATVRNGTIRGWSGGGIKIADARGVRVENVVLELNRENSIYVGPLAQILGNRVSSNGSPSWNGVLAGHGSLVEDNVVEGMTSFSGISCGESCRIRDNIAIANVTGIFASSGSNLEGNTAHDNSGNGIAVFSGSTVSGNTAYSNGGNGISATISSVISDNSSYENALDGIQAAEGCTIRGNSVRGNAEWGLDISSATSAYRENTISTSGTALGTVDGGTDAGGNLCNGSLTCP